MSQGDHRGQGPDIAARAADPHTSQTELHQIAASRPDLRAVIAANPNAYPQLLEWLRGLHDPQIDAALAGRQRRSAEDVGPGDQPTRPVVSEPESQRTQALPATSTASREPSPEQTEEFGAVQHPSHHEAAEHAPVSDFDQQVYGSPAAAGAPAVTRGAVYADYQQPVQAQPLYPAPESPRPRRKGGGCAVVLLLALVTLAALVGSYVFLFGNPLASSDVSDQGAAESEPAETEESDSEEAEEDQEAPSPPEDAGDDEEEEPVRPAPENALSIASFSAPSDNIHCTLGEDEVLCTIDEHFFEAPSDCQENVTLRVSRDGTAETACDQRIGSQGTSLDYGEVTADEDFACESTESHFECWSQQTGHGFELAREYYSLND